MRILILPFVFVLLCCSNLSFSQAACGAGAYVVNLNGCITGAMSANATGSGVTAAGNCGYSGSNRRVTWFQFTPTGTTVEPFKIDVQTAAGAHVDMGMEVVFYNTGSNACPATINTNVSSITCLANAIGVWAPPTGFTFVPGRTYWMRIYTNNNSNTAYNIKICTTPMQTIPIAPSNPCNNFAIDPLGTGSDYSPLPTGVANRCGYANDRRVTWFKFIPTTSTCPVFKITPDTDVDIEVAFFTGTGTGLQTASTVCMPKTSVGVGGVGGIWAPALPFTFVAGTTYYLRIYTNINDNNPHFLNICAKPYTPPNDLCSGATRIDNNGIQDNNVCATGSIANGGTEPAWITSNSVNLLCAPQLQNTEWYYFVINDNTTSTIVSVSSVNCDNYGGGDISSGNAGIQLGLLQGPTTMANCVSMSGSMFPPPNTPTHCYQTTNSSFGFTVPPNASIPNGTKMYIAVDGYSGANCSYTITTNNAIPIPVKLRYFTAWKEAQSNQLRWITSWETNNKNFEIERSLDGREFVRIGAVPGLTSSNTDVQYRFDDYEMPPVAYYRLKQVDIDGKYEYSNTVVIKRDDIQSLFSLTFANPVSNNSIIRINTETAGTTILRIIDLSGREISTQVVDCSRGNNLVSKDFSRLAAGHYFLIATQGESRIVKPFIKQ